MRITARTAPRTRLAAAALGAGVLLTGIGAAPALAVTPLPHPWYPEHGMAYGGLTPLQDEDGDYERHASLGTGWNLDAEDVRVTVAPWTSEGEDVDARVEVPILDFDEETGAGRVDLIESRRLLGEPAHGPVAFRVHVLDHPSGFLAFDADDDLTDEDIPEVTGGASGGLSSLAFEALPVAWEDVKRTPAEQPWAEAAGVRPEGVEPVLVRGPEHGTLLDVWAQPLSEDADPRLLTQVYIADEGFVGEDSVVHEYRFDGEVRTQTIRIVVGDPDAQGPAIRGEDHYGREQILAAVEEFLAQRDAEGVPEPGEDDSEHSVPETVETGSATAWWLAAAGALGAGALLRLRPGRREA